MDDIARFKAAQREGWAHFTPFESITCTAAPHLVRFADIRPGQRVLDVGCGTGVVAVTAAQRGAHASGVDLTPELIERARQNAAIARLEIDFAVGDAEELPHEDAAFDVVVSQFGHMFAPRADVVVREMLRVLKPGGTIAFSTWPPDLFTGRMFALTASYLPPPPPGVTPPPSWGDPANVRQRLGEAVRDLRFERAEMRAPALSPTHFRNMLETNVAQLIKLVATAPADRVAEFRRELEALIGEYFEGNTTRQEFLMSRAVKVGAPGVPSG